MINPLQKWGTVGGPAPRPEQSGGGCGPQTDRGRLAGPARPLNKTLEETTTLLTKLTKLTKLAFQEQKLEVLRTHP